MYQKCSYREFHFVVVNQKLDFSFFEMFIFNKKMMFFLFTSFIDSRSGLFPMKAIAENQLHDFLINSRHSWKKYCLHNSTL